MEGIHRPNEGLKMPVSKEKEKFIREAGSAIVALIGVNDQTSLLDIHKVRSLKDAFRNSYSFHMMSLRGGEESEYEEYMAKWWGSEFAKNYPKLKGEVRGALWDLYFIQKCAKEMEDALKYVVNTYTEDTVEEWK